MKPFAAVVLAVWLGLVLVLGVSGAFVSPLGAIPLRIAIGVVTPVLVSQRPSGTS